jgi:hypothetical protein
MSESFLASGHGTPSYSDDQRFFTRMAVGIAVFSVFGFVQFAARGMVDFAAIPWWVHLHAAAMVGWLALFVTQNMLAERGHLALHRRLGWTGLVLALVIGPLGVYSGQMAITLGRVPPFFSDPFFLALTSVEATGFVLIVVAAILQRRRTEWHRRLMLVSTVVIMEPALGRLLPMPLLGHAGEWVVLVVQLMVLAVAAWHDQRLHRQVHPALMIGATLVILVHCVIQGLAITEWAQAAALELKAVQSG